MQLFIPLEKSEHIKQTKKQRESEITKDEETMFAGQNMLRKRPHLSFLPSRVWPFFVALPPPPALPSIFE
jgi:hypothetical protein